jgi:hypothetical protein
MTHPVLQQFYHQESDALIIGRLTPENEEPGMHNMISQPHMSKTIQITNPFNPHAIVRMKIICIT